MTNYRTKYFGEINLDSANEYYSTEIEFNDRTVDIGVNFSESKPIEKETVELIENHIVNLQNIENQTRTWITKDFKEGGFTKDYIDIQIDYQDKDDIADLIEETSKKLNKKERLLSVLYLKSIQFYPEQKDFVVYDYTIDEDLTDDLLVVIVSKENEVRFTIES